MRIAPLTDISSLASLILNQDCQNILLLTGAGVSVASGIPDFRSLGGFYETLDVEAITASDLQKEAMRKDATICMSQDLFWENQLPYLEVRRPLILSSFEQKWKPTIVRIMRSCWPFILDLSDVIADSIASDQHHHFVELLHTKLNKLRRVYTQNIDGLYQQTRLPRERIVNVHGTISEASCEGCFKDVVDYQDFVQKVRKNIKNVVNSFEDKSAPKESSHIYCEHCGRPLVKPSVVLYGGILPYNFFQRYHPDVQNCDLLIVAGTSLVVGPANEIVRDVNAGCVRVVMNKEKVGAELGIQYESIGSSRDEGIDRDLFLQGSIEELFLELCLELGWTDDLLAKVDELPKASADLVRNRLMKALT